MKLGDHKRRKVMEPDFSGKFLFGQKMGKNGPKKSKYDFWICDFQVFLELTHYFFLIVCMKLEDHVGLCVTVPNFSRKISFSEKEPKNRVFGHLRTIESLVFAINDLK